MKSRTYYKDIDYIRLIACLAVLFYHLSILKGGFLAVCVFFVLSGYLSCVSAFKKNNFSLKEYYLNKLVKLYVPLFIIVMVSIAVISFIPNISWMNLKPETFSVLFGYNNYWQLNANLDYFAMHINSPFMHFWFIAILLQFDLIFPFIFLGLKKLGDNINKSVPCIITGLLAILGCIYFYIVSLKGNIMVTYYDTFSRLFSLLLGVFVGFIHTYYGQLVPDLFKKKKLLFKIIVGYVIVLILSFIFIEADFKHLALIMLLDSFITCRLLDYCVLNNRKNLSLFDKGIISLSSVSYVVYLVQYPIIYLLQLTNINSFLCTMIVIFGSFIIAYIFKHLLNFKNSNNRFKVLKVVGNCLLLVVILFGGFKFVTAKDYKKEMDQLEQKIHDNEELVKQKQEEYAKQLAQKKEDWANTIDELEKGESTLETKVHQLPLVGIGDSVMLGAVDGIYKKFPNSYIDAKISRTAWVAKDIIIDLKKKKLLDGPVVFNLGANGDCSEECKRLIVEECGDREIFWVNVTNDEKVHVNDKLAQFADKYDNVHVIDWNALSKGHEEYFYADGIHLTSKGITAYSDLIYDSVYQVYLDDFNREKDDILNKYKEDLKADYLFVGNDILINSFDKLHDIYPNAKYITDKDFTFDNLKNNISKEIEDGMLPDKIVLEFDNSISFTKEEYQEIINLCGGKKLYIVVTNNKEKEIIEELESENVKLIDFSEKMNTIDTYLDIDGIHLNESGNDALIQVIKDNIN